MGTTIEVKTIRKPRDKGKIHQALIKIGKIDCDIDFRLDREGSIIISDQWKEKLDSLGIDHHIVKGAVRQKLHSMIENGEF